MFGFPYFQDGKWWIFKSIPNSEKIITDDCEDPCGSIYTHWATKIEFRPIRGTFFDQQTEQIELHLAIHMVLALPANRGMLLFQI